MSTENDTSALVARAASIQEARASRSASVKAAMVLHEPLYREYEEFCKEHLPLTVGSWKTLDALVPNLDGEPTKVHIDICGSRINVSIDGLNSFFVIGRQHDKKGHIYKAEVASVRHDTIKNNLDYNYTERPLWRREANESQCYEYAKLLKDLRKPGVTITTNQSPNPSRDVLFNNSTLGMRKTW